MEAPKYSCEKCGGNHPMEGHVNLELNRLTDPYYLPSRKELVDILKPDGDDLASLKDAFHNRYDRIREIGNELLNREFITKLTNYLETRIALYQKDNKPVTILEVGAGNGRLGHFLQQELNKTVPNKYKYITTNIRDSKPRHTPVFPVEEIDYSEALKKYHPTIVVSSWMPYQHDWTAEFRATPSVQEYILIGEQSSTGDEELTWGITPGGHDDYQAAYDIEGFERKYLEEVSEQQVNSPKYVSTIKPVTYSFRRK